VFEQASKWLHHILHPILLERKQHLKDSLSLIRELSKLSLPKTGLLFTFDIASLYPSIPTTEGLTALHNAVSPYFPVHRTKVILAVAELILRNNYLSFNNSIWLQIKGTAMGSNFAVVYACLFLAELEDSNPSFNTKHLIFYKRYIDDAFGIWDGPRNTLTDFLNTYGAPLQQHIRIECCISDHQANILDITFYKGPIFAKTGTLDSSCYQKPLNAYLYLPWSSAHPSTHKKGFIIGELKRYVTHESSEAGFLELRQKLYQRLRARGYPITFLRRCFGQVSFSMRRLLLHSPTRMQKAPMILKIPYTTWTKKLRIKTLLKRHMYPLIKQPPYPTFTMPLICWINGKKIRTQLTKGPH
jgi:hypothetical protein